jgi:hypothetical protein
MAKHIRNTFFTALVLMLTAFGLRWNKIVIQRGPQPLTGQSALAGASKANASDFKLATSFSQPSVGLGQENWLNVKTLPFAQLDVLTTDPHGSRDQANSVHAKADEMGHYATRIVVSDFHQIGQFKTTITAQINGQQATVQDHYQVTAQYEMAQSKYNYPLLP